jgi:hypothetical protein
MTYVTFVSNVGIENILAKSNKQKHLATTKLAHQASFSCCNSTAQFRAQCNHYRYHHPYHHQHHHDQQSYQKKLADMTVTKQPAYKESQRPIEIVTEVIRPTKSARKRLHRKMT